MLLLSATKDGIIAKYNGGKITLNEVNEYAIYLKGLKKSKKTNYNRKDFAKEIFLFKQYYALGVKIKKTNRSWSDIYQIISESSLARYTFRKLKKNYIKKYNKAFDKAAKNKMISKLIKKHGGIITEKNFFKGINAVVFKIGTKTFSAKLAHRYINLLEQKRRIRNPKFRYSPKRKLRIIDSIFKMKLLVNEAKTQGFYKEKRYKQSFQIAIASQYKQEILKGNRKKIQRFSKSLVKSKRYTYLK